MRAPALALFFVAALGMAAQAQDRAQLMQQHRGGTLRLLVSSSAGTLDPQINYEGEFWQVYANVYDGLTAFKKVAGPDGNTIVADLAESVPKPQDDGRTFVFKLRHGIQFANGREVTAADVVASFRRIFKISGPTSGSLYGVIVGAEQCLKSPADCTLDGGVVADPAAGTITFHLTRPDPEFLDKLALPHASVLPADTPAKDVGTAPIPGTGPYMIASYEPNKEMLLKRNPAFHEWSVDAQPEGYPDVIQYEFGLEPEAEVTEVENGQADWMGNRPPLDRLAEIGRRFAKQIHINPVFSLSYLAMNTRLPPFDNAKARQAVAYAMDRRALVNLVGGPNLASPACQILPPGFPGYVPYCPYSKNPGEKWTAPDMQKAQQLMKESGTAGHKVTLIVADTAMARDVGTYVQSVLRQLGYDAALKAISGNIQFSYIQNSNNMVQISATGWNQDYPAASDFLNVLFSCGSFHPGSDSSINISEFCDPAIDARMQQALEAGIADPQKANQMWAEIDRAITDLAPAVPLFNGKTLDFVSARVGNFVFNNQYLWLFSQAWVR
ncbi:MAG: ABC transporter substrate-binding protein [Alphaproteobacteria bacterium]|nr:ABC transporter substrate-binding protein [Alphaproteobacteria bacterium]